ncbi:MAG TPA: methyltransferase domain-containing protein [Caldisericia bacterium]|nr:methyltransferase domain-containing protein [Caldisericia bacterium]
MALFDSFAPDYDSFFATKLGKAILLAEASATMKAIRPQKDLECLDAGCGTGIFTSLLAKSGMRVTGIDESTRMLDTASKKPELASTRLVNGKLTALPFENMSFDRVFCSFALEFVDDQEQAAKEIWRVLRPNGIAVVAVLNPDSPWAKTREGVEVYKTAKYLTFSKLKDLLPGLASISTCVHFLPADSCCFGTKETWGNIRGSRKGAAIVASFRKAVQK